MASNLEIIFPDLRLGNYRITSPCDHVYNCIALAAGDDKRWWEPVPLMNRLALGLFNYFWPDDVPLEYSLDSYSKVFTNLGYVICDSEEFELGYEKVALYTDRFGIPSHAARLQQNRYWISKLGEIEDIEHENLHALENSTYGKVALIFKRALPKRQE